MRFVLYTIGHSTHSSQHFLGLISQYSIDALVDVRSHPFSRYNPQFSRETLKEVLKDSGIEYVFLGDQLGVRSKNPAHYINGKVQYSALAASPQFSRGQERILKGMQRFKIALMCAEKDPITCHRAILVTRHLRSENLDINHILEDGTLEGNNALEDRLLRLFDLPDQDLFTNRKEMIERAYDLQSERIAYTAPQAGTDDSANQ